MYCPPLSRAMHTRRSAFIPAGASPGFRGTRQPPSGDSLCPYSRRVLPSWSPGGKPFLPHLASWAFHLFLPCPPPELSPLFPFPFRPKPGPGTYTPAQGHKAPIDFCPTAPAKTRHHHLPIQRGEGAEQKSPEPPRSHVHSPYPMSFGGNPHSPGFGSSDFFPKKERV